MVKLTAFAIFPALFVYIFLLLLNSYIGISPELVLRDLMQTCNTPPIGVGLISNLGILLWGASASISLFAAFSGLSSIRRLKNFLLLGGIFSAILCIDDLLLIHDRSQLNQDLLYGLYIIFAIVLIYKYRKIGFQAYTNLLLTSVSLLGLSVFFDIFQDFLYLGYDKIQIIEEGFKFIGISSWLYFWIALSRKKLKS